MLKAIAAVVAGYLTMAIAVAALSLGLSFPVVGAIGVLIGGRGKR